MTAEEMFDDIFYRKIEDNEDIIIYTNKGCLEDTSIQFLKNKKQVIISSRIVDKNYFGNALDLELELKAINKQIEELGWEI